DSCKNQNVFLVFQLLTDLKQQRKESGKSKQSSGQQNLNTIMYETLKYISKTPCRYQSPETVKEFLVAMKGHKLTKAEKLQLLNHRPVTAVEIQLVSNNAKTKHTKKEGAMMDMVSEQLCRMRNGYETTFEWKVAIISLLSMIQL
uniref:DNA-directed RNA polymerase III subunit RPC9 n=1 Tax=Phasianus colchicus TaxID=9054 RepID=A0A669P5Z6_PHACC